MRKTVLFLFALLASVILVSCGDDKKPVKTETLVQCIDASYWGDYYMDGGHNFSFTFSGEGVSLNSTGDGFTGTGLVVDINLNAYDNNNLFPTTGDYPFTEETARGTATKGYWHDLGLELTGIPGEVFVPSGTVVRDIVEGLIDSAYLVVDGKISVEGTAENAKFTMDFVMEDGSRRKFLFEGSLGEVYDSTAEPDESDPNEGLDYTYEPTEVSQITSTLTEVSMKNYGDFEYIGKDVIYVSSIGPEYGANMKLYAPLGTTSPYGTYKVLPNPDDDDFVCIASPGGDPYTDEPSYVYGGLDASGDYSFAYYMISGTVTISESGIVIDFVSYNGSFVKLTYDSEIPADLFQAPAMQAPQKAVKAAPVRLKKRFRQAK